MHDPRTPASSTLWANFRFSVIGPLLASPPARGELKLALAELAAKSFSHPTTAQAVRFSAVTIERWYYKALKARDNPARSLRRRVRKDAGRIEMPDPLALAIAKQHSEHPSWTYQLHHDNLAALVRADSTLGTLPSYSTLRRYMQARGLLRRPRVEALRPGEARAARRLQTHEVRSFEVEHVGGLWHLDFHHASRRVLVADGSWKRPIALGVLDDCSRICCHLQWYLSETTEDLVHGFSQALQKHGLPRALQSDNGSAMTSEEFRRGLLSLSILHETTLPYSPHQNGKQETFWRTLESRLLPMLESVRDLTLELLNLATQAWVDREYNRGEHSELKSSPSERYTTAADVSRPSPTSEDLRDAFRIQARRKQRKSDGTISIEGTRFEIPSRFRHLSTLTVRYARWDLTRVHLVDERADELIARIYPLDRHRNAEGRRALVASVATDPRDRDSDRDPSPGGEIAPRLAELLREYSATGLPPAYVPKPERTSATNTSQSETIDSNDETEPGR